MIPDFDLARVRRWINQRDAEMPPHVHDQLCFEIDVTDPDDRGAGVPSAVVQFNLQACS